MCAPTSTNRALLQVLKQLAVDEAEATAAVLAKAELLVRTTAATKQAVPQRAPAAAAQGAGSVDAALQARLDELQVGSCS